MTSPQTSSTTDPYPHPFRDGYDLLSNPRGQSHPNHPKPVVELLMLKISWTIRQKERWWEKIHDPDIRNTWIKEVHEQQDEQETPVWQRLTEKMLHYILAELGDHARIMQEGNGIQMGPHDRIWYSDGLLPGELTNRLIHAIKPLEDVPDDEKDWHPGSNQQVLDLVHPSLCPLVYGSTYGTIGNDGSVKSFTPPPHTDRVDSQFLSSRFQWLPSDFAVSQEGDVKLLSSYINNIHPEYHAKLVGLVETVIQDAAIPLWQHVLSDLRWSECNSRLGKIPCIWEKWRDIEEKKGDGRYLTYPCPPDEDHNESFLGNFEWQLQHPELMDLPDCKDYDGNLYKFMANQKQVSLAGTTLQVIVKFANIILTPDKPEYPGGKWHVEGMHNEHIVSTCIFYYDSHNVEDAVLKFGQATTEPCRFEYENNNYSYHHPQDDNACMKILYDMDRYDRCFQEVGGIETKKGRCLAFPNLYQHQVSSFKLVDTTQPGYRKIFVLFLVDPTIKIPSATTVPPRQLDIMRHILREHGRESRLSVLPTELLDYIAFLTPGVMDRAEAEAIREELIKERIVFTGAIDKTFFGYEFNMCEH